MDQRIVKIQPYFEERMWGGKRLIERYDYHTDVYPVGEVYNVVALENHADCCVEEMDTTLSKLYKTHPEWFCCDTDELPIRVNILDPEAPLSIQLHPDDPFAKAYNGGRGKPEAWVVLDAPDDGTIAFGHTATSKKELLDLIDAKAWKQLISYIPVVVDDYLDIPCGTLHAIGTDVLTYNISRNADCTLRLYDYERIDPHTKKQRDLQVDAFIKNLNIPDTSVGFVHHEAIKQDGLLLTHYFEQPGLYTLKRIVVNGNGHFVYDRFGFYTCVEGAGTINDVPIKKGETVLVPESCHDLQFDGTMDLFLASYRNV